MKERKNLPAAFRSLRELPPEVTLAQVQEWVARRPIRRRQQSARWKRMLPARYLFPWSRN